MKAKIYKVKAYTNEIIRGKFSKMRDLRVKGMVDHPLADVLIILMLGVMCGLEKSEEIVIYARNKRLFLSQVFGIVKIPSYATLDRILDMVDGEAFSEVIIDIMKLRILKLGDIVAVDGKSIRSTIPKGKKNATLQILTAYFTESGVVLGQKYISEKTNEIPMFQELLCYMNIEGKTITADAMHCQKDTCSMIIGRGGDYIFTLKGNHQTLLTNVSSFFADPENADKIEVFEPPLEKRSGRTTQRIFYRINDPMQFDEHETWTGLKSIFAVRRIVTTKYETTDEIHYYISSLDSSPERLLFTVREHWKIESMHWLLDVVFSEDEHVTASKNAHKTLNILRKFALLLHKTYIKDNNLKISLKNSMFQCLTGDDDLILHLCLMRS
jgi:predicted transposase YbfD/YdcC